MTAPSTTDHAHQPIATDPLIAARTLSPAETQSIGQLLAVMTRLRNECPWDQKQTPQSLTRYAIEEAYEVEAAIQTGDIAHIRDELGDLLLQVIFQAEMYRENAHFDFFAIADTLSAKLIRRHPHVFGEGTAASAAEVSAVWEQIKQTEKAGQAQTPSRLSEVKPGPSLMQAQALQKAAAKVGFDWPNVAGAQAKLLEEVNELDHAIASGDQDHIEDELGDALFALVNVARKSGIQSESALLRTIAKFRRRFAHIETRLAEQGKIVDDVDLAAMDILWDEAKRLEKTTADPAHNQAQRTSAR